MLAIALALGSSACYGVSNFVGPQLARRHAIVSVLVISHLAALAACAVYLAGDGGEPLPPGPFLLALLAGLGNALGLIGFYRAAELGPLSIAAPIGATGAIVPVVWGIASGDSLEPWHVAGIVLAMGGAVLASRPGPEREGEEARRTYPDPRLGAIWAAASAVAFGVFLTALPDAAEHGRAWALFDARVMVIGVLILWAGKRLSEVELRRDSASLAIPGLLLVAGTILYTVAADHGRLSVVSVLGSLFPVFTVGLGVALLGERLSRGQAVGVTAALAGIVLIAL